MTIYEIDKALLECVDDETGEVIDTEKLDAILMERDTKVENIACWIKDLIADAKKIDDEITSLENRKKSLLKKAESLRSYLEYVLKGEEFKSAKCVVGYRASKSLNVTDENKLFAWLKRKKFTDCFKVVKETKINKAEVTKLIKADVKVPFAELVENKKMNIK